MPTGIGAVDALFGLGRGILAIPQGVREEGASGVPKALLHPGQYESSNRARNFKSDFPEEEHLRAIIDHAESIEELQPAVEGFHNLQQQAIASGMVKDPQAYQQALEPLSQHLGQKIRQLLPGLGEKGSAQTRVEYGLKTGLPELQKEGQSIQEFFRKEGTTEAEKALAEYRGEAAQTERERRAGRVDADVALAEQRRRGPAGRAAGGPKLTDLDRLGGQLARQTTPALPDLPIPEPNQATLAEYNRRAVPLGRPPQMFSPSGSTQPGLHELTGGAAEVAGTLGAVPGYGAQPYVPPSDPGAPLQQEALPQAARIQIPDVWRQRATSSDPQHALSTSEMIAFYRQQGLSETEARSAARQAVMELGRAAQ